MKSKFLVAVFLYAAVCFANAQQKETVKQSAADEKTKMMDVWMKYATPGESHKLLEPMAGRWNAKTTMWETPGSPPQESTGTSENTWVLGGRYLEQS